MIGRKISDQSITCKVIKPMQVVVNSNSSAVQKGESPSKQTTRVMNVNYEPMEQSVGRVFGMSNNLVDIDVEVGFEYENQFNRLNHFAKEDKDKNLLKNVRDVGRIAQ